MASVKTIRTNLAKIVQAALGDGWQVSHVPVSAPAPQAAEIAQFGIQKHAAMGVETGQWWTCVVRAYVAVTVDVASQDNADALLENDPVTVAIEADPTLSGACSDLIVDRADQRFWDHPAYASPIVGVEWQLRILI